MTIFALNPCQHCECTRCAHPIEQIVGRFEIVAREEARRVAQRVELVPEHAARARGGRATSAMRNGMSTSETSVSTVSASVSASATLLLPLPVWLPTLPPLPLPLPLPPLPLSLPPERLGRTRMRARTRTRIVPAASTGAAAVAVSERAPSAATTSTLSMPDHGNNTAVAENSNGWSLRGND